MKEDIGWRRTADRRNTRNEVIRLTKLLESACRTIETYFGDDTDVMPNHLRDWWIVQRRGTIRKKIEKSEAGVADAALQVITLESEMTDRCCE